jgi:predicted AlkP superfamily phosphohydrolase/phosphomutase
MYTGTNPARHGMHYLLQIVPGTYELRWKTDTAFVSGDAFWRVLSDAGRRVAILDVPLTQLDPGLDGVQTVEWGGHDSLSGFRAHPPELGRHLLERYGAHPAPASCDAGGRTARDHGEFIATLERGAATKGKWTRELLERGGWDLVVQVFTEAHCAGHQCWHIHDAGHPAHDANVAGAVGDPLRRIYRAIDSALGEVIDGAGDARIVVFSAHGMGHWYGAHFLLGRILERLGVTSPRAERRIGVAGTAAAVARDTAASAWRHLPEAVRELIRALRRFADDGGSSVRMAPTIDADFASSLCFPINNGLAVSGIRLNLIGREPRGLVQSGEPARTFCNELESDLLAIRDERTGRPLIRRVLRTDQLYVGPHRGELPDLLVEWSDDVATGSSALANGRGATVRASSAKIGTVQGVNDYGRTGEHRPGGWLVAAGPGIPHARLARDVSLLDLAPTFTRMLGVDLPGAEGRVIQELMSPDMS